MQLNGRDIGSARQQSFSNGALVKITGARADQIGTLVPLCQQYVPAFSGVNVEIALSVASLALCLEIDVEFREVARVQWPLVNAALTHLACNSAHWCITGTEDDKAHFHRIFDEDEGADAKRLRVQTLLGTRERACHRYLVRRSKEGWTASDTVREEAVVTQLDAEMIADRFSRVASPPYFTWVP